MSAPPDPPAPASDAPDPTAGASGVPDPTAPLTASGNLRRRAAVSRVLEVAATAAALLAVGVFLVVVYAVASRGLSAVSFSFLTTDPSGLGTGGIAPSIVGSAEIVAMATGMAMPVGVMIAIFLIEFAGPRTARVVRLALDLMNGLPTVVVALTVYSLLVLATQQESGFAAAVALAIIMLPLIARSSHQVLLLVPNSLREAANALGVARWRGVIGVVLPSALGGIVTATILAAARAAGESAPLIVLDSLVIGNTVHLNPTQAMSAMPFTIFQDLESGVPSGVSQAWGTALVLMALILAANVGARVFLARNRSRLGL